MNDQTVATQSLLATDEIILIIGFVIAAAVMHFGSKNYFREARKGGLFNIKHSLINPYIFQYLATLAAFCVILIATFAMMAFFQNPSQ
jgi:hypothetical protein